MVFAVCRMPSARPLRAWQAVRHAAGLHQPPTECNTHPKPEHSPNPSTCHFPELSSIAPVNSPPPRVPVCGREYVVPSNALSTPHQPLPQFIAPLNSPLRVCVWQRVRPCAGRREAQHRQEASERWTGWKTVAGERAHHPDRLEPLIDTFARLWKGVGLTVHPGLACQESLPLRPEPRAAVSLVQCRAPSASHSLTFCHRIQVLC